MSEITTCDLYWTRSFNLNNSSFLSGVSYVEIPVGPYLEGQQFNIPIRASYGPIIPTILFTCPQRTIKYESSIGEKERRFGLDFDNSTGVLSGAINDIDGYLSTTDTVVPFKSDGPLSYLPVARRPNPRRVTFYIKAYFEDNPEEFVDGNFYMDISVNWDTKRKSLIVGPRAIETDFFVDGKPATNDQYYSYLQRQNYI